MENQKMAVLIDADNAQASACPELLAEIARFGIASVKRAYGDWTMPQLRQWKDHLHKHAIQPIQQFSHSKGKNATDSALIIDAMDLLHEGKLDGFCLVSSDSDFTRLATRIRESGLNVYGFGEKKTPESFISACDKFVYTEIFRPQKQENSSAMADFTALKPLILKSIAALSSEDGWAPLSSIGHYINKNFSDFDSRNYGYEKLGKLIQSLAYLETQGRRDSHGSPITHIYARLRKPEEDGASER